MSEDMSLQAPPDMAALRGALQSRSLQAVRLAGEEIVFDVPITKSLSDQADQQVTYPSVFLLYKSIEDYGDEERIPTPTVDEWKNFIPHAFSCLIECGWNPLDDDYLFYALEMMPRLVGILAGLCIPSDLRDRRGNSLLHLVSMGCAPWPVSPRAIRSVLELEPDVNATSATGNTPLHEFLSSESWSGTCSQDTKKWVGSLRLLLEAGADVEQRNDAGEAPAELIGSVPPAAENALMKSVIQKEWDLTLAKRRQGFLDSVLPEPEPLVDRKRF